MTVILVECLTSTARTDAARGAMRPGPGMAMAMAVSEAATPDTRVADRTGSGEARVIGE